MRIIDLFSGAGGLTFGFNYNRINGKFVERNNVEFIFANEYAAHAVNAFRQNFPRINMIQGDIKNLTNEKIHELTGNDDVDIIIGGPPCQSFSTVGKRNYDDRAKLSIEYLRVLEAVRPKMFLFENVRGILSMREIFYLTDANGNVVHRDVEKHRGETKFTVKEPIIDHYGQLIIDKLRTEFERLGYTPYVNVVKAADFGVPQNRERVVIVGMRNDLGLEWQYPKGENPQLTISDAISDLPTVGEGQSIEEYDAAPMNEYQQLMRGDCQRITEHYCGIYGNKIRTVIQNVAEGEGKKDFNAKVEAGLIDRQFFLTSG